MLFETRILTCMDKVFLDQAPQEAEGRFQGFQNENIDFQVAFRALDARWEEVHLRMESPLRSKISVRLVRQVPVQFAIPPDAKEDCLRTEPGLYPDLLSPLAPHALHAGPGWVSLWVRVKPGKETRPGAYPLKLVFEDGTGSQYPASPVTVWVLPGCLPPQTLIHTKWFHCDCLAQYYRVPVFSERHWAILEKFLRCAVAGGINMILTPIHTPPLDTRPGGERLTVQLVDITVENGEYRFGMDRLRRWIALCKKCGVQYFEAAHLFTQWGAEHAPKIVARVGGVEKQIFGWDTDAAGEEYGRFLRAYIPVLRACFREEGVEDRVYWHISDEPHLDHLDAYAAARGQVEELLRGCPVIDALSDFAFYSKGLVPHPIPANDKIGPFLEADVPGLWTYYCCGQTHKVSNMFIAFPSYRNRVLGAQLFKYRIQGFLQWGFNFYNSHLSDYPIDPFQTTDADGWVPAGDPFQVYPGADGEALESIRMAVTTQAMQDLRAMEWLSSLRGRDFVCALIDEGLPAPLTFTEFPRNSAYLPDLRRRIDDEIVKARGIRQ